MSYTQLTREQRYTIYALKKRGKTQTEIAETIGVHKSTVSREIKQNTGGRGYRCKQAHRFATKRRKCKANKRITEEDWAKVEDLIKKDWSPEQISGRLKKRKMATSATNGSISISGVTRKMAEIYMKTSEQRKSTGNAPVQRINAVRSRTELQLKNDRKLLTKKNAQETGKRIQ